MGFLVDIRKHNANIVRKTGLVHEGAIEESFRSVVHGSEITGAPALPVDPNDDPNAGKLRDSVTLTRESETESVIWTDVDYAPSVEDDTRGQHFHNGGPHGWKITAAGYHAVVDIVAQKVADSA